MNTKDWANVIQVMRSAPLPNMDAAEEISTLIQKVAKHAQQALEIDEGDEKKAHLEAVGGTE